MLSRLTRLLPAASRRHTTSLFPSSVHGLFSHPALSLSESLFRSHRFFALSLNIPACRVSRLSWSAKNVKLGWKIERRLRFRHASSSRFTGIAGSNRWIFYWLYTRAVITSDDSGTQMSYTRGNVYSFFLNRSDSDLRIVSRIQSDFCYARICLEVSLYMSTVDSSSWYSVLQHRQ